MYSGGLDSLIMRKLAQLEYPDYEVIYVYYDIGHDYSWKEKAVLPSDVIVHDMSWFNAKGVGKEGNNTGNCFIPGRNMVFATLAASQYLPTEIWLGALQGEIHLRATDKNYEFAWQASLTLSYVLSPFIKKVSIIYPLAERGWGKLQATEWALEHGMRDEVLRSSSCMEGESGNCGRCATCARRWGIFTQLEAKYNIREEYNVHPVESGVHNKMFVEMIDEYLNPSKTPHYDSFRVGEIVPALQIYFGTNDLAVIRSKLTMETHQRYIK